MKRFAWVLLLGLGACDSTAAPTRKLVFVTSQTFLGNFGSLAAADALCNASAAGKRPGDYQAWLSDGATSAIDRIVSDGPFHDQAGNELFSNRESLKVTPKHSIDTDENFTTVLSGSVWTGTAPGGQKSDWHCLNWTSSDTGGPNVGTTGRIAADTSWTDAGGRDCNYMARLYCFQK